MYMYTARGPDRRWHACREVWIQKWWWTFSDQPHVVCTLSICSYSRSGGGTWWRRAEASTSAIVLAPVGAYTAACRGRLDPCSSMLCNAISTATLYTLFTCHIFSYYLISTWPHPAAIFIYFRLCSFLRNNLSYKSVCIIFFQNKYVEQINGYLSPRTEFYY